jgi:hypothetical protein
LTTKIKNTCYSKDIVNKKKDIVKRMKVQVVDQEEMITKHVSDKKFVFRIYKQLSKLINKNTKPQLKRMKGL